MYRIALLLGMLCAATPALAETYYTQVEHASCILVDKESTTGNALLGGAAGGALGAVGGRLLGGRKGTGWGGLLGAATGATMGATSRQKLYQCKLAVNIAGSVRVVETLTTREFFRGYSVTLVEDSTGNLTVFSK